MGIGWNSGWRIYGAPLIQRYRGSHIELGTGLEMRSWFSTNPLGVNHRCILATWSSEATIKIGNNVGLTGTTICAKESITIGSRVQIGANTTVVDTDFHPLTAEERLRDLQAGSTSPVIIEADAFIGMSVLILKGSHIGAGSLIGAGSVVTGKIPPNVIAAGNPARVIKDL